jgi:hypothetical protein
VKHLVGGDFRLEGIAFGTIVAVGGYHLLRAISGRAQPPQEPAPAEADAIPAGGPAGGDAG